MRERGRAVGGRLASPELHGRRVDLGAAYFTAKDAAFRAVVDDWQRRGLVHEWTDTFAAYGRDGRSTQVRPGPVRDRAGPAQPGPRPARRRAPGREVTALSGDHDVTVLAMPDPQAARLAGRR